MKKYCTKLNLIISALNADTVVIIKFSYLAIKVNIFYSHMYAKLYMVVDKIIKVPFGVGGKTDDVVEKARMYF